MGLGRLAFGFTSSLLGVACLILRDQLISNWQLPGATVFLVVTSLALIVGGIAVAFERTREVGALLLSADYSISALTFVPDVFTHPGVYASYGNVFYELAPAAGAFVAYRSASRSPLARAGLRPATIVFGLSNVSFAIEQVEFLGRTSSLVPTWMPPGQTFWAIATTVAFALAGISIVSGYLSPLASRLVSAMLAIFGVAIWIPLLVADPKAHGNWSEGLETFVIAGAAWILADFSDKDCVRSRYVTRS